MIIGYSRTSSSVSLPTTNMTGHWDFSDITTLYKSRSAGSNPGYSNQATADGDAIRDAVSLFPAPTSELVWDDNGDTSLDPILRITSPGLPRQCLDFDGSNDRLVLQNRSVDSGQLVSVLFNAGAKTALISFRCESLPASSGTFQPLMADNSGNFWWGIYIYNNAGTVQLLFQNHDGNYDSLFHGTIAANTNYVATVRHDGTNTYASLNSATEDSLASGNTSNMTGGVLLGGGSSAAVLNGRIGEVVTYNAALTGTDLSNAKSYMIGRWT